MRSLAGDTVRLADDVFPAVLTMEDIKLNVWLDGVDKVGMVHECSYTTESQIVQCYQLYTAHLEA